ncbi:UNVERIFIED_CONTAM: hypothetical protein HDU68_008074 [Siphonaria sp. JEL0065]|nr:hypothetical protein HDU68_008074 [Siphonaria sp. JEL0065]
MDPPNVLTVALPGQISRLLNLATNVKADVVIHMGDFSGFVDAATNSSASSTVPSFVETRGPSRSLPKPNPVSASRHTQSTGELDAFFRGEKQIHIPVYVIPDANEVIFFKGLHTPNLFIVLDTFQLISVESKNCDIRLMDISWAKAARQSKTYEPTSFCNNLAAVVTRSSKLARTTNEVCILVADACTTPFVSQLDSVLDVDIILSMSPTSSELDPSLLQDLHKQVVLTLESRTSSLLKSSIESVSPTLVVEMMNMDSRYVKIECTSDRVTHSVTNLGRKTPTVIETIPLKRGETRPFNNPWENGSHSTDVTSSTVSSPGDWLNETIVGAPLFHYNTVVSTWSQTTTIHPQEYADSSFRGDADTMSDMTEVSELDTIGICTVLVGNFPDETTEAELKAKFRSVNILRCKIVNNKRADRRPFAFLDVKEADRDLVLRMNGERFHGAKLKVEYDPSRLEKLGRKRVDSVKLEMSSIMAATDVPHTLKKSNSLSSLDAYTSVNGFSQQKANQFGTRTSTMQATGLARTRSQLMMPQLAQTCDSWNPAPVEGSSSSNQDSSFWEWQQQQPQMLSNSGTSSLNDSPSVAPKTLALKSTWDSPPRKKDPFTTGANWDRPTEAKWGGSASKDIVPASWNNQPSSTAPAEVATGWGNQCCETRYRSSSELSSGTANHSNFSSPESTDAGYLSKWAGVGIGKFSNIISTVGGVGGGGGSGFQWNQNNQSRVNGGDGRWGETVKGERAPYSSMGGENSMHSQDLIAKTNAMASVMSFNQQIMNGAVGAPTGGSVNVGGINKSSVTNLASMNYDGGAWSSSTSRKSSIGGDGGIVGTYKNRGGNQNMTVAATTQSVWQQQQPAGKPLYASNIW